MSVGREYTCGGMGVGEVSKRQGGVDDMSCSNLKDTTD